MMEVRVVSTFYSRTAPVAGSALYVVVSADEQRVRLLSPFSLREFTLPRVRRTLKSDGYEECKGAVYVGPISIAGIIRRKFHQLVSVGKPVDRKLIVAVLADLEGRPLEVVAAELPGV